MNTLLPVCRTSKIANRRAFLEDSFCGFGAMALAALLHESPTRASESGPLAPRPPHFQAQANSVIFLFMAGGPSHLDLWDLKEGVPDNVQSVGIDLAIELEQLSFAVVTHGRKT